MAVYNYIASFVKDFDIKKLISLNMYNIGFIISSSSRAKNYLNLDYLINLVIRAEEDRKDIFNMTRIQQLNDNDYADLDYETLTKPQPPYTFSEYSDGNLHIVNEKNNLYIFPPHIMFYRLSKSFKNIQPDLEFMLNGGFESDQYTINKYNYNYFRLCLFNDTPDEKILCFNTAINLLIEWIQKLDKFYLSELSKMGIQEDETFYKSSGTVMLENNDLFGKRK